MIFLLSLLVGLTGVFAAARASCTDQILDSASRRLERQNLRVPRYTVTRHYTVTNAHLKAPAIIRVLWSYVPGQGKQFKILEERGTSGLTRRSIVSVLEEEAASSRQTLDPSAITSGHYLVKQQTDNGSEYKLSLVPREKTKYLLNGTVSVQRADCAITGVDGVTAKRISFWVSEAHVIQEFAKYGEFWLPSKTRSIASVRFVGRTELLIEAGAYQFEDAQPVVTQ